MYEQGAYDVLTRARSFVNSFHVTSRTPPEVLGIISSYLTEEDLFSASQVCQYWRSALISSSTLWTRISCRRMPRTIASLKRCGSLPIQLRLEPNFSDAALKSLLLHENKIVSLTVDHQHKVSGLHNLLMSSRQYLEQLHIYVPQGRGWGTREQMIHEVWQDLPCLRNLFISRSPCPIHQLAAPNLIHLALEHTGYGHKTMIQAILDMLRRCPLLETLLLSFSDITLPVSPHEYFPVCLPHLRSIEVGAHEVRSGLITHLDFPKSVTAGLRGMRMSDLWGNIPSTVMATTNYVLRGIDIYRITLSVVPNRLGGVDALVRFEGPRGSLEITTGGIHPTRLPDLFGPQGVLFSHQPRIEDVRELHIIGRFLNDSQELRPLHGAMPNVTSISFLNCSGAHMSELLAPSYLLSPPFPNLEFVVILGPESELEEVAWRMRDLGVRLKTLIIGREPGCFEHGRLKNYTMLEGLADDLWVGCPVQILEWEAGNEIANIWSRVMAPAQVSLRGNLIISV